MDSSVLPALSGAKSAPASAAGKPAGQLTTTEPMLFGQMHVAPDVMRFVQQHTQMRCSVAQPVGHIRRMVVASPVFLQRYGVPTHLEDLQKADCVRVSNHGLA